MAYVLRRLITQLIPVLFVASILIFVSVRLIPGDPVAAAIGDAMGGVDAETYERLREELGLTRPIYEQYWIWLGDVLTLEFGDSLTGLPVTEILWNAIPASVELAGVAIIIGFTFGLLLGIAAAVNRGGPLDWFAAGWTGWNIGVPSFIAGLVYLIVFAVWFDLFPVSGRVPLTEDPIEALKHLALPGLALGGIVAANISRFTRQSLLDTLTEDYIRTARAKGLTSRAVIARHALRPSMIPVVTIMGLELASILSGTLVIETVFTWPGLGRALINAVNNRDYTVIQATTLLLVFVFVVVNLLVDLAYVGLDPRIRIGGSAEAR